MVIVIKTVFISGAENSVQFRVGLVLGIDLVAGLGLLAWAWKELCEKSLPAPFWPHPWPRLSISHSEINTLKRGKRFGKHGLGALFFLEVG